MKRLLLLRHAKSAWDEPSLSDFDRPLAPRGLRAARAMGGYLADEALRPDLVLCSAAARTRETWDLVAAAFEEAPPVEVTRALYEASPHHVVDEIRARGGAADTLCVVGHHPGIDGAALMLSGTGDRAAMDRIRAKFPTGAVALVHVDIDSWAPLVAGMGELIRFVVPKELA